MLNIGGWELLVIFLAALVVLGPERLPEAARQIGRMMSELRKVTTGFQRELNAAMKDPVSAASRAGAPDVTKDAEIPPMEDERRRVTSDPDSGSNGEVVGGGPEVSADPFDGKVRRPRPAGPTVGDGESDAAATAETDPAATDRSDPATTDGESDPAETDPTETTDGGADDGSGPDTEVPEQQPDLGPGMPSDR